MNLHIARNLLFATGMSLLGATVASAADDLERTRPWLRSTPKRERSSGLQKTAIQRSARPIQTHRTFSRTR